MGRFLVKTCATLLLAICIHFARAASDLGACAHVTRDEFADRARTFAMMKAAGLETVRCDFDWNRCQRNPDGVIDWSRCDAVVNNAAANGLTVLPILASPPGWAKPIVEHLDDWRHFVRAAAEHFKGRIPAYEIWNEENHPGVWKDPNPSEYLKVLRSAYEEIKAADLAARVVVGGMAGLDLDYVEGLYAAGGRDAFDIMNVHPYCHPNPPTELGRQMARLRALMARHGNGKKPIWITEMGWPTHQAKVPLVDLLRAGLKLAKSERTTWRLGCVDELDDMAQVESIAADLASALGAGYEVRGYGAAELTAALATNGLDAVVYPYTESFPWATWPAVRDFVKRGGVLVDFGGSPMYYPCENGKRIEKATDGTPLFGTFAPQLGIDVYGPNKKNGLRYNIPTYVTDAALAAGMKPEPQGFKAFRFFTRNLLKPGDEMIPLLSVRDANGEDAVSACVIRYAEGGGAAVVSGCSGTASGCSEARQAEYLVQARDAAHKAGVEKFFVYEFRAPEKDACYSEDHFGIVHRDFTPKPAYETLKGDGVPAVAASGIPAFDTFRPGEIAPSGWLRDWCVRTGRRSAGSTKARIPTRANGSPGRFEATITERTTTIRPSATSSFRDSAASFPMRTAASTYAR